MCSAGFNDSYGDSSNSRLPDSDGFVNDFCDFENSDAEEYALPDDFPEGLFFNFLFTRIKFSS